MSEKLGAGFGAPEGGDVLRGRADELTSEAATTLAIRSLARIRGIILEDDPEPAAPISTVTHKKWLLDALQGNQS